MFPEAEQQLVVEMIAGSLTTVDDERIRGRSISHFRNADNEFGDRLEALIKELRASGQSELVGHESIDRREAQLIAETCIPTRSRASSSRLHALVQDGESGRCVPQRDKWRRLSCPTSSPRSGTYGGPPRSRGFHAAEQIHRGDSQGVLGGTTEVATGAKNAAALNSIGMKPTSIPSGRLEARRAYLQRLADETSSSVEYEASTHSRRTLTVDGGQSRLRRNEPLTCKHVKGWRRRRESNLNGGCRPVSSCIGQCRYMQVKAIVSSLRVRLMLPDIGLC